MQSSLTNNRSIASRRCLRFRQQCYEAPTTHPNPLLIQPLNSMVPLTQAATHSWQNSHGPETNTCDIFSPCSNADQATTRVLIILVRLVSSIHTSAACCPSIACAVAEGNNCPLASALEPEVILLLRQNLAAHPLLHTFWSLAERPHPVLGINIQGVPAAQYIVQPFTYENHDTVPPLNLLSLT